MNYNCRYKFGQLQSKKNGDQTTDEIIPLMEASAISFLNIKLLFLGAKAASIGKTYVFIIEPDI